MSPTFAAAPLLNPAGQAVSPIVGQVMARYGLETGTAEFRRQGLWSYASERSGVVALETSHFRLQVDADLGAGDSTLVEAIVTPNSQLESRTLKGVNFRNRFGATALAIRRHGEDIREKIGHVRLRLGDELLILVPRRNLDRLRRETSFVILQELELPTLKPLRAVLLQYIVAIEGHN